MRFIHITQYDEQLMMLAKPVYDRFRRILLSANSRINPKYLDKLKEIGIHSLIVEDAISKGITMEELVDMPTWMDVIQTLNETYDAVQTKKPFPLKNVQAAIGKLILETRQRSLVLPIPASSVATELKPYAHSVNVAILALQVAKGLNYNDMMLRDLALGCLLHDIGKAVTADSKKHPEEGFEVIRRVREASLLSAHIAFQHHERVDGTGYPRGIAGKDFHEYAQICGMCNRYENMTSAEGIPSHDAIERLMALSGSAYDVHLLHAFVTSVPSYPPGSKVLLNNGKYAIVTKIVSHMQRPMVRYLETEEELLLADHPTVMVTQTI
ncbi:HD domain-containing protein [Paenibacillus sp. GD4]|jgi:putative nucleotidyltransferase with HDIG domain|uniref:HD-GYP domain-containing protein n=1 Tax=Paenibacillus sp. GD4 TaxID=3068890 RepID=UPI0027963E67|nr:HD domain-containing phosphohydrolase [Paenibacillus sp. GD4]MDQ1910189.1 HD domain-containing protein [Paenibacillus sp. GD4]